MKENSKKLVVSTQKTHVFGRFNVKRKRKNRFEDNYQKKTPHRLRTRGNQQRFALRDWF